MPTTDRRRDVLDSLGHAIVTGEMAPGHGLTLEAIQSRYGVSRTLARDCVHTLESIGVVASRRRVGIVVQPREHWSALAPELVRWQLEADPYGPKLGALTELRTAIEPVAAAAAARRATEDQGNHRERRLLPRRRHRLPQPHPGGQPQRRFQGADRRRCRGALRAGQADRPGTDPPARGARAPRAGCQRYCGRRRHDGGVLHA